MGGTPAGGRVGCETGVLPALELSANEQKVYDTLSTEEI